MSKVKELLGSLGVAYKEQGNDLVVKCLNPEHTDSHPSMRIDSLTGIYNCFSCGYKGNLLKEHGIRIQLQDLKVHSILKKIQNIRNTGMDFPMGYTPFRTEYRGVSAETIGYFEAFTHPDYEDRLMFPLRDISGGIQCFIGRYIHSNLNPKYKFYPDKTVPPLFPARPISIEEESIILVEGIFDAMNCIDKGLQNVQAALGTTTMHKTFRQKLEYLKILGVQKIYVMFDGDEAGTKAGEKLVNLITQSGMFLSEQVILPEGIDPGDLTEEQIAEIKKGIYG
jgi:DNA primase